MVVVLSAGLALTGCATLADRVGVANKAYADQQAAQALEKANAATQERLDAMLAQIRGELESVKQDADQVKAAIDMVNQVVASMTRMQELAKEFDTRLATLPEETLRKLVEILSAYLAEPRGS